MIQPADPTELDPVIGTVSRNASEGMALRQAGLPKLVELLRHAPLVAVPFGWCAGNA